MSVGALMNIEGGVDSPQQFRHQPVMLRNVLDRLGCRPGGIYVDATCGLGGHAESILKETSPDGQLVAVDRDEEALEFSRRRLTVFGNRLRLVHDNFKNLPFILNSLGIGRLDGALLDLGVSSMQFESGERGFSIQSPGPLDMRMDRRQQPTAADLVNRLDEKELADTIYQYGQEPASRRIARHIIRARQNAPIRTTTELVSIVKRAVGRPRRAHLRRHVATRTFQALRIAVNDELRGLDVLLCSLADFLQPGGRIVVISFHSLEDRIVKNTFRRLSGRCVCGLPSVQCLCERREIVRLITTRPEIPSHEEVRANPRSRSAKLRCVEKI